MQTDVNNNRLYLTACHAARRGQFKEAISVLQQALAQGACTQAEAFDLMARIHAQQGHLLKAESYWLQAQAQDADNPVYEDALARLRRPAFRPSAKVSVAGLVALMAMVILLQSLYLGSRVAESRARLIEDVSELSAAVARQGEQVQAQLAEFASQVAELRAGQEESGSLLAEDREINLMRYGELNQALELLSNRSQAAFQLESDQLEETLSRLDETDTEVRALHNRLTELSNELESAANDLVSEQEFERAVQEIDRTMNDIQDQLKSHREAGR